MITREGILAVLNGRLLTKGAHIPGKGACVMEAVAWAAGESWTDMPRCVAPTAARLGQRVNDAPIWRDDQDRTDRLIHYAVAVAGRADREEAIAYAVRRVVLPILFRRAAWRCGSDELARHAEILAVDPSEENRVKARDAAASVASRGAAAAAATTADFAAAYATTADYTAAARREFYEQVLSTVEAVCLAVG